MNIKKIIRSADWWEYKLPPLLAIGYATALKAQGAFLALMPHLLFLLFSIIIGAIYVSIINDVTDIEIDLASGKKNKMAGLNPNLRWILPVIAISIGGICAFHLYPDWWSILLYSLPWVSFSLYSFKPVRLKDRGILGVFADASGSHVFTSLLMISSISYIAHLGTDWLWFISTALWAVCYGIRGILWHQFYDRKNDLLTGTKTYATKIDPLKLRKTEIFIFTFELIALLIMVFTIEKSLPFLFLLLYICLALIRSASFGYVPVLIISPEHKPIHILMGDYYQVLFPLSLLVTASIADHRIWFVVVVHLLCFPQKPLFILRDGLRFTKSSIKKLLNRDI